MAELPSNVLVIIFLFIMAGMITALSLYSAQAHQQAFVRLARRFRGKLEERSVFSLPVLRLRHQGAQAVLRYTQHGKNRSYTHFQIQWPDAALRLEIYPQDLLVSMRKLLGMTDLHIGSPGFDADFFISTNDPAAACQLLSGQVQQHIYALARVGSNGFWSRNNVYVEFAGGVLKLTRPISLKNYSDLEQFIRLSLELFDFALQTRDTGIEFLECAPPPDAESPRCQVCGDDMIADIVHCPRCKTPHHRDCWQYFGGCSTYACEDKDWAAMRRGRR